MNPVIETRNLLKTYRADRVAVEALRGVDLRVAPGEFVAVMGPSGCGKSTLLHLLGGLDRPTAGEVVVAGQRLDALSESARAVMRRETVGFVFQAYNLIPNLTVADNVDLPGLLAGHPSTEVAARREELLEALGLADKDRAFPGELSGGQQQRAAIARALVNRPAVLLADEPTGNLDSRSGAEVLALLRRFHADGQTTVLVTHDAKVASFAGRVIFMRDGQLVDEARLTAPGDAATVLSRLVQLEL
ncbi:MAG: ABC transporter ATP-binding protein [Anaerolineae bacterium]|nr:ABC transporter ATP-binding protein [Anaerolineae bacterium]